jgi:hypothetical protein
MASFPPLIWLMRFSFFLLRNSEGSSHSAPFSFVMNRKRAVETDIVNGDCINAQAHRHKRPK